MIEALQSLSRWTMIFLLFFIPLVAWLRGVNVFHSFAKGAAKGLEVVLRIFPYLLGIMIAVGIFRSSGALDALCQALRPFLASVGVPPEVLPLAFLRPLSGSGSLGYCAQLLHIYGPDSLIGRIASVMQGSTDTTFYILAVYFGSVGIKKYHYAPAIGLAADFCGFTLALVVCKIFFT
ncbi:MAG: nucleoside recognition domain-containing protein [Clostridia bacterium]|nr:nucleoside recognition domain-containing protein [Clostridia bacterium]MDD4798051.1 nucleoside recognition domain-containing protein [Clostridia bacterium]